MALYLLYIHLRLNSNLWFFCLSSRVTGITSLHYHAGPKTLLKVMILVYSSKTTNSFLPALLRLHIIVLAQVVSHWGEEREALGLGGWGPHTQETAADVWKRKQRKALAFLHSWGPYHQKYGEISSKILYPKFVSCSNPSSSWDWSANLCKPQLLPLLKPERVNSCKGGAGN